jgi:hypothetical protein
MHGAESLAIARDRGLIKPAADLEALSYWLQGQFFGFILLETAEKERLRDEWKRASLAGISATLGL